MDKIKNSVKHFSPHTAQPRITLHNMMTILIDPMAFSKMAIYVANCPQEVGWLGYCERMPSGDILVKDVYLPKQQVNAMTTELDPQGQMDIVTRLYQTLPEEQADAIANSMHLWGHSHGAGGVIPSGQDWKQLYSLRDNGYEWVLGIIANSHGLLRCTYLEFNQICIEDVPWQIYYPSIGKMEASILQEIKENVQLIVPATKASPLRIGLGESFEDKNRSPVKKDAFAKAATNQAIAAMTGLDLLTGSDFLPVTVPQLVTISILDWLSACQFLIKIAPESELSARRELYTWCQDNKSLLALAKDMPELKSLLTKLSTVSEEEDCDMPPPKPKKKAKKEKLESSMESLRRMIERGGSHNDGF